MKLWTLPTADFSVGHSLKKRSTSLSMGRACCSVEGVSSLFYLQRSQGATKRSSSHTPHPKQFLARTPLSETVYGSQKTDVSPGRMCLKVIHDTSRETDRIQVMPLRIGMRARCCCLCFATPIATFPKPQLRICQRQLPVCPLHDSKAVRKCGAWKV